MNTPREVFEKLLPASLKSKGDKVLKINAIFQFNITGQDKGLWYIDTTKSGGLIKEGERANPDCVVTMDDVDFMNIANKKIDGRTSFQTGKLRLEGDIIPVMKLLNLLGF